MRRRALLSLALLPLLPRAAPAQSATAAGRQALALAAANRWAEAEAAAAGADPIIRKVVTWLRLQSRTAPAGAAELVAFQLGSPDWPAQDALARRTEEALAAEPDDALAVQYFAARAPRGLEGYGRLADALARAGRPAEAVVLVRKGWTDAPGDPAAEPGYLARGGLSTDDHWARYDRLSFQRDAGAGRAAAYLDPGRAAVAAARGAYAADRPDADVNAASAPGDLGLTLERARWLRRRERDAEAAAAWSAGEARQAGAGADAQRAVWTERQVLARKLIRLGGAREAYGVAAAHGQALAGESRQEGEFLAGWIALRRLNDPARAAAHFARVAEGSRSVITRARGYYWQGRAHVAAGEGGAARRAYAAAAELPLAFYGQLGAVAAGEDGAALSARIGRLPPPTVAAGQEAALLASEPARAVFALAELGETRRTRPFFLRLEELAPDAGGKLLVARLAQRIGRPDNAVWVARRAGASGAMLLAEGWPAPYPAPVSDVEPALVNAITRQESNFDPEAVSSANARGLMQLLPGTAQMVARRLGVAHGTGMLTTDPAHNMTLGAGYLSQMLARFGGAVPLAVAAYNAGPGRVDEWLGTYGDPRGGSVTMLDWMELIPFTETRNYVQRVLENVAIYRARDPAAMALPHPMSQWPL